MIVKLKDIIIRKLEIDDCYEAKQVINKVWRIAYADFMPKSVFDKKDAGIEESVKKFKKQLQNNEIFGYVAIVDSKIVGVAIARNLTTYEHYKSLGFADLQVLYILSEYQGIGLGSKFFKLVRDDFKNAGITKMLICALEKNVNARAVYEKWDGKLDETHKKDYETCGETFVDVFYLFDLQK